MLVWVLNGPNLNFLGTREPDVYGQLSLAQVVDELQVRARGMQVALVCKQTNHEGELIDWLQEAVLQRVDGVVINPGGLTHQSVVLRDALACVKAPKVEVHVSNIYARESFRRRSLISPIVDGVISGLGVDGYHLALQAVVRLARQRTS